MTAKLAMFSANMGKKTGKNTILAVNGPRSACSDPRRHLPRLDRLRSQTGTLGVMSPTLTLT